MEIIGLDIQEDGKFIFGGKEMKTKQQLFDQISFKKVPFDSVIMGGILAQTMELVDLLITLPITYIESARTPKKEIELYAYGENFRVTCRIERVDTIILIVSRKGIQQYYEENLPLWAVKDQIKLLKNSIKPKQEEKESVTKLDMFNISKNNHIGFYFVGKEPIEKFWKFSCPCGVQVSYPLNGLPEVDTRFPCSNPEHWVIKFKPEETKEEI